MLVLLGTWAAAQDSPKAPESNGSAIQNTAPSQSEAESQTTAQGQMLEKQNETFVFKKEVQEVLLHATVVDEQRRSITNLDGSAFSVFEDDKPQRITSFRREDVPVAIGIVIDDSGSMRDKRPAVNAAAINLVRASNPKDRVFIVNFSDECFLDQDYTSSIPELQTALEHIEAHGGTALYDATIVSADHLEKSGGLERKVLLVVTDGEDNASHESLEQAVRRLQVENGPTVYTIGLLQGEHSSQSHRALGEIAEKTGGVAFFPKDLTEVNTITTQIAHAIRNQYTIGYKPYGARLGGYRTVRVDAVARGYTKLQVLTRSGYYVGQQ
jgi:VWFA-related protein